MSRPSVPLTPRTAALWTFGTVGLTAAAVTTAAVLWRVSSKRFGAAGIGIGIGVGPAGLHLRSTSARPPQVDELVSVLIPVRHEADPTVAAVRAALGQLGVGHLDIVVLDDGCPQETRAALRQEFGDDPRVRILAAAPLPRGWSPRAHRSHQLAVAARGRVLIFAEPSAPLGPHAAASVTALLRGEHLDLAVLDTGRPAPATYGASAASASAADSGTSGSGVGSRSRSGSPGTNTKSSPNGGHRAGTSSAHVGGHEDTPDSDRSNSDRQHGSRAHSGRSHPGRFTLAVDAEAYWRTGGYRTAADDPDPLALLRMVRRASGRVAVADGRRVIPPAQLIEPLPPADPAAEAAWDSLHNSRVSLSETARRVLAALVGARS